MLYPYLVAFTPLLTVGTGVAAGVIVGVVVTEGLAVGLTIGAAVGVAASVGVVVAFVTGALFPSLNTYAPTRITIKTTITAKNTFDVLLMTSSRYVNYTDIR